MRRLVDACVLASYATLAACGGATAVESHDSGAGSDTATDAFVCGGLPTLSGDALCPTDAPVAGAACTTDLRLTCEYGDNLDARCNILAHCTSGTWVVAEPSPSATCPPPPNDATCAASLAAVPRGSSCSTADAECTYPAGRCVCVPLPSDPSSARWVCDDPAAGCPQPRPKLGSACTEGDYAECAYGELGECLMPGGVLLECAAGCWTEGNPICQ